MPSHLAIAGACLISGFSAIASGSQSEAQIRAACQRPPVEPCVIRHGRLSTQNGITQTIWLIGTTRRVSVNNQLSDFLPSDALKYTEITSADHSYIFGNFTICPVEPDLPGHMRDACVTAAKDLVVQRVDNSRPPFRIRSTWSNPAPIRNPK
jgi:hypothetical protein